MASTSPAAEWDNDPPLDPGERAELEWLRAENKLLRTERDILTRAATGLAEAASATLFRRGTHGGRT